MGKVYILNVYLFIFLVPWSEEFCETFDKYLSAFDPI